MLRTAFRLLCVIICCLPAGAEGPADLSLPDLSGRTQRLRDHLGKVVVVNFWATWCSPCKHEMPMLVELQRRYPGRVAVIGISIDDHSTRAKIPEFLKKQKVNFSIWVNGDTADMQKLGLGEAVPATAFLDEKGNIVGRVLGQLKKQDVFPRAAWMLGERSGSPPEPLVNRLGNKQ